MKNQINVLVTAVGGPTAIGILKCLKGEKNIRLVGTDSQNYTAGNVFCDKLYCVPRIYNIEEYKNKIVQIIEAEDIDIIFPTLQDEISIYHELQKKLKAVIALPTSKYFEALINKEKLYKLLESGSSKKYVPVYFTFQNSGKLKQIVDNSFKTDDYICVKGVQGHGSIGFALLTNRDNYLRAVKQGKNKIYNIADYYDLSSNEKRIVMEYLDGIEYSVDVFLHQGDVVVAIPRKRSRVSNGIVIEGMVEFNQEIIDAAINVSKNVATDGFLNLQFIGSNHGYKLTDLNARFCGSQIMSYGAGVNFPYLFIQYNLLNQYIPVSPKWNTRMVRYWESCFFND